LPRARSERTRSSRPRGRAPARNISPLLRSRLSPVKPAKSHHDPRLTTTLRGSVSKERPETIWKKLVRRPGTGACSKAFHAPRVYCPVSLSAEYRRAGLRCRARDLRECHCVSTACATRHAGYGTPLA
jgi:hypothetical protein